MPSILDRIRSGWNAFTSNKDPSFDSFNNGYTFSFRPDRPRMSRGNERSIITSVYNRLALDVASNDIEHVKLDKNGRFVEEVRDSLNNCLKLDANIDQTGRALIMDIVTSMFDEGHVAVVPIDTNVNPYDTSSYDILTMRTGKILEWYPSHVKMRVYNERKGIREDITLPKARVAIIENPFYAVMNEPNSTLKRLIRKLTLIDAVDEQNGAGKLDLIIQLPYVIKTEARKQQAENRRKLIESQLSDSKYGIAYTDGTERITQLNRPIENQLLGQIEYLTNLLYSQLGLTQEIMNGTASEEVMLNYYSRTIEPILTAITEEMTRKFLSKTARTQGHSIYFFRDPFKLVPISKLTEFGDKFTRNEILSTNEVRGIIGMKPSDDPSADELRNKNMPIQDTRSGFEEDYDPSDDLDDLDQYDDDLDDLENELR